VAWPDGMKQTPRNAFKSTSAILSFFPLPLHTAVLSAKRGGASSAPAPSEDQATFTWEGKGAGGETRKPHVVEGVGIVRLRLHTDWGCTSEWIWKHNTEDEKCSSSEVPTIASVAQPRPGRGSTMLYTTLTYV
jgi:hypothetical protein